MRCLNGGVVSAPDLGIQGPWFESHFRIQLMAVWHITTQSLSLSSFHHHHTLGWLGVAKVSCFLRHRGVQLILAYSWARPTILVAGKGRGGMFLFFCFFTFIPVPLSSLSLSFISTTMSSIFFLLFSGR